MSNYWIFQASPDVFHLRNALKNDALTTFSVNSHKKTIAIGDKVIVWWAGSESGCYALCRVVSGVERLEFNRRELPFILKLNGLNIKRDAVKLSVEYNLWNNPIFKSEINAVGGEPLKTNIPGTNFRATAAQYQALLEIIKMRNELQEPRVDYQKYRTATNHSLNQILFGPPGTGKTYHAVNYAISIIEDKPLSALEQEPREQLLQRFREYRDKRQIEMVTFHQSFTYEDFVEGIKPETTPENQVIYEVRSGIFKAIASRANQKLHYHKDLLLSDALIKNANIYKVSLQNYATQNEDDGVFEYCIKNNCIALGWGDQIDFSTANNERDIKEQFLLANANVDFGVTAIKYLKLRMEQGDIVFVPKGTLGLRAIGVITGDYYYDKNAPIAYSQFRKVRWLQTDLTIPVRDFYPRNFSQMAIYKLNKQDLNLSYFQKRKAGTSENNRHVLIIDEINRGNVSAIFGELITLIEPDKRKFAKEHLTVELPYSKQSFDIPNNLYLIGTMNTADRSAEALDHALRRRFTFVEQPPNADLLKTVGQVDLSQLLEAINRRIEVLLDRDHLIGHAYFLPIKTIKALQLVFKNKLIPLLKEYFYGDWAKIGLVLGKAFVQVTYTNDAHRLFADFEDDMREDYDGRAVYAITNEKSWDEAAFQGVYRQS